MGFEQISAPYLHKVQSYVSSLTCPSALSLEDWSEAVDLIWAAARAMALYLVLLQMQSYIRS